jgi:hypothetical protein
MQYRPALAMCAFVTVCSTQVLEAQNFSTYRQFELGTRVAAVSALTGTMASETKTIHQRPAVLQELEWRPSRWTVGATVASTDPVARIVFSFYDEQLFRIAVDYGTQWTKGMTPPDLIQAISAVYGTPNSGPAAIAADPTSPDQLEAGSPLAWWGDTQHAVVLYQRVSYTESFHLVVADLALAELATTAAAEARRLDDREAPQRELARQKKALEVERDDAAKARLANKPAFQP